MMSVLTDLRIALRTLFKAKGFSAAAVLSLGLGLTLCTAVLASVNAYLVRGLPYPGAERLCSVRYAAPGADTPDDLERLDWASLADVIDHPIAWDLDMFYLVGGDHPESAPGAWVTPDFVEGFGVRPALGRGLDAPAFVAGSPQVALISHRLWQSRFGGNPGIIGQKFDAYVSDRPEEAESFTIAGVLPADFWHTNPYTDIIAPLRAPTYPYMVRLREGTSRAEAAARITALVRAGTPGLPPEWHASVTSTHDEYVARVRPILNAVSAAAALVLLVALANVAALVLIRATRRQKEIAVRMALGAGRGAIARLFLLEALLLGAAATVIALAASALSMHLLGPMIQRELGRSAPGGPAAFGIDWTVIGGAVACGLLTVLACGLAPLAASWRAGLLAGLHSGSRTTTEGRGSHRTRSVLIALEVAASLALLGGSTLMIQSVAALVRSDPGIRPERVLSASITLRQRNYADAASRLAFFERVAPRVAAIPGVESVALATSWPLQASRPQSIEMDGPGGRASGGGPPRSTTLRASVAAVSSAYFKTMGVPIASGRAFEASDRPGTEPVAIVSEALARRISPDGRAIGARVSVPEEDAARNVRTVVRQVVGIAGNVRQTPADEDLFDLYVPLPQIPTRFAMMYVRTSGAPVGWLPQLRAAFKEIDPEIPLNTARPLQAAFDEQLARPAFLAWLLAGFAMVAAMLALVGVYGVIAYAVRQREREIAVRIAIGAEPRAITALFVKQGSLVLLAGLVLGVGGAIGAGRTLESQLFGISPGDPLSLAATAGGFAMAGFLALWWPARRAAHTDPAMALKEE
jgi:putative ABC transport system permease protein